MARPRPYSQKLLSADIEHFQIGIACFVCSKVRIVMDGENGLAYPVLYSASSQEVNLVRCPCEENGSELEGWD